MGEKGSYFWTPLHDEWDRRTRPVSRDEAAEDSRRAEELAEEARQGQPKREPLREELRLERPDPPSPEVVEMQQKCKQHRMDRGQAYRESRVLASKEKNGPHPTLPL